MRRLYWTLQCLAKISVLLIGVVQLSLAETIRVQDDAGEWFEFEQPLTRVVSLIPHGSELLFAAGGGDALVGAVEYSDYPEAALAVPRVGGYSGIHIEHVIALKPQLILVWPEGNQRRELEQLKRLGYRLFVSGPQTYDDIARNIERLGELTGHRETASQVANDLRERVQLLRERYQQQTPLTVFYQVWHQPLMTQNGNTFISQAISLCGGINVYADLPMQSPQISLESVLLANPDVIVASGMGESRPDWLDDWRRYGQLKAVRSESLYHIHPDLFHRPTPRFLLGTEQLCSALQQTRKRLAL